jgi:hypothetical protein
VTRRVLVCGDRYWSDWNMVFDKIERLSDQYRGDVIIIQGGAPGADAAAKNAAEILYLEWEEFPADWKKHGQAAGPIRNRQMLDTKPDLVLAFHDRLDRSRGTKDCVTEAIRRGIPVDMYHAR